MSKKELFVYKIIHQLIQKKINGTEAAAMLGITVRHVRRLKQKVKSVNSSQKRVH